MDLCRIQDALSKSGLDGWLFYDFRGSDPLAASILQLDPKSHTTRRWFYYIPSQGEPTGIVHAIERTVLDFLPGRKLVYLPWRQLEEHLGNTIAGARQVAMQYSPRNAVPYVSRVDAGTLELVRSNSVEVVSSADLVQQFEAVLTQEQFQTHIYAAESVSQLMDDTFAEIGCRVRKTGATSEYEMQQFMWDRFADDGLVSDHPPVVAVNANTADPHYCPTTSHNRQIREGDFILIDVWAKQAVPGAVFFDITWTAFLGDCPPKDVASVFSLVCDARDAAIRTVQDAVRSGAAISGWEVDDVARGVIQRAGFGEQFIHRTGHSIHTNSHGNGANIDNLETLDDRRLITGTCFSIEPGIYLEGRFGVRSEVDVYISDREAIVTGRSPQTEIVTIAPV